MALEASEGAKIYQGESKDLVFRLQDEQSGDPFDLTSATVLNVLFPLADGTALVCGLTSGVTVTNAGGGMFTCHLSNTQTNLMELGTLLALEVRVEIGANLSIVQIPNALTVAASLFPLVP